MSAKIAYVSEVNTANFDEFVKMEGIVVIDLWAKWCAPCLVLGPILEMVAADYTAAGTKITIGKMDVDVNRDKAADLGVSSVPTIFIYKDGEMVDKNVGMIQKIQLKKLIEKHIESK